MKASDTSPLSVTEKIGYALGELPANFYGGFFSLYLVYYYTDVWGIAPAAIGGMMLIVRAIDAITDPVMGLIADRTNSRWGKYRPYIFWVAIPYGILGYALFFGPELSDAGKLIYAYATYTGVMMIYTAINVPYSALLAVISPIAEERTKVTMYKFLFAGLGSLCVAAFVSPLTDWLGGGDEIKGFRLTMALFATFAVILFWVTFAATRERIKPVRSGTSVRTDFAALLKNKSWVVLSLASVIFIIAMAGRMTSIVFYVKYYLGDDGSNIFLVFDRTSVFTSLGIMGQIFGSVCMPYLVARFEKGRLMMGMCLIHAALLVLGFFLPPELFWLAVLMNLLGFITFGVCMALVFVMYTDCAEYSEWLTGKSIAALTMSASIFAIKFGSAVGAAIPGFVLAMTGFVANELQTQVALEGIRAMFFLVPAVMFILVGVVMAKYRIDKAALRQVETEMYSRRHPGVAGDPVHEP